MCPLGRRYWSRYANLMRLLSCWRWMAAKPQTGKVGHGGCSQSGEWKAGKHLSIKASAALKMTRLKTRGCLNERSPDRRGWKIDWIQIAHKSDFFFFNVLLYGQGSCWGDTRKYLLGNICPLAKSESGIQKDNSLEKKERRGQADKPRSNRTINKKSKPHWWPDCQKGHQSLRGLNLHLSLFLAALPQTALIDYLTDIRLAPR